MSEATHTSVARRITLCRKMVTLQQPDATATNPVVVTWQQLNDGLSTETLLQVGMLLILLACSPPALPRRTAPMAWASSSSPAFLASLISDETSSRSLPRLRCVASDTLVPACTHHRPGPPPQRPHTLRGPSQPLQLWVEPRPRSNDRRTSTPMLYADTFTTPHDSQTRPKARSTPTQKSIHCHTATHATQSTAAQTSGRQTTCPPCSRPFPQPPPPPCRPATSSPPPSTPCFAPTRAHQQTARPSRPCCVPPSATRDASCTTLARSARPAPTTRGVAGISITVR